MRLLLLLLLLVVDSLTTASPAISSLPNLDTDYPKVDWAGSTLPGRVLDTPYITDMLADQAEIQREIQKELHLFICI